MKGLSILLTLALLILAHELSAYFQRSDSQPAPSHPVIGPLTQQPEIQLQARTNARGIVPKHLPAVRAEGKFRGYSREPYPEPPSTTFEI